MPPSPAPSQDTSRLEYVGFKARSLAWTIDSLIVTAIILPFRLYFGLDIDLLGVEPLSILLNWVVPAVPTVYCWLRWQSTPGKMVIRARVVDADTGLTPSKRQLAIRYVGYLASTLPLGLGFMWVGFDPRRQGWHDKMAETVVVRDRREPRFGDAAEVAFFQDRSS